MVQPDKPTEAGSVAELDTDALIRLAEERVSQGLSPPPEIYRVENRRRVDWSRFPTWAQPGDPEVFDGCCHEG